MLIKLPFWVHVVSLNMLRVVLEKSLNLILKNGQEPRFSVKATIWCQKEADETNVTEWSHFWRSPISHKVRT